MQRRSSSHLEPIPKLSNPLRYLTGSSPELPLPPPTPIEFSTSRTGNPAVSGWFASVRCPRSRSRQRPALLALTRPTNWIEGAPSPFLVTGTFNLPPLTAALTAGTPSTESSPSTTPLPTYHALASVNSPFSHWPPSYASHTSGTMYGRPAYSSQASSSGAGLRLRIPGEATGAEIVASNESIRANLERCYTSLAGIWEQWDECSPAELERTCSRWEDSFEAIASQVVDYSREKWLTEAVEDYALRICAACLKLDLPRSAIWDSCETIRRQLAPYEAFDDWCAAIADEAPNDFGPEQMPTGVTNFASRRHSQPIDSYAPTDNYAQHQRSVSHQLPQTRSNQFHQHGLSEWAYNPTHQGREYPFSQYQQPAQNGFTSPSTETTSSGPWTPVGQTAPSWANAAYAPNWKQGGETYDEEDEEDGSDELFHCER